MKRVLILDANQRSALAVTRSLGKQGVPVFTAEETPTALAGSSRFSGQYFSYSSPRVYPEHFIDDLTEIVHKYNIDMLLPMTELTTTLLLTHQALFHGTIIPFPNVKIVDALADKCSLMRLAETLNIPIPHTWYVDTPDALPCDIDTITYPIVLKPSKSWQFLDTSRQWTRLAVRIAHSPLEARQILDTDPAFISHPFMIQEFIKGHGQGVFALYNDGQPVSFFAHRRLREKPPGGGVSVLSESIAVDPKLQSHARLLLDKAGWHGVAMVEFKVAADGTAYLMEINTRFWGSLQLAVDAGIDFPYLLYNIASGHKPEPVASYKTGIRLRWLLGDLDSLYLTLRDQRSSFREKLKAMLGFMLPTHLRTRHEVNRREDFRPFWFELKDYVRHLIG